MSMSPGPMPVFAVAEDGEQDLEVADEEEREEREEEPVHMPDPVEKEDVVRKCLHWRFKGLVRIK